MKLLIASAKLGCLSAMAAAAVVVATPASAEIFDGSFETEGAAAEPGCTDLGCPQAPWQVTGRAGFNEYGEGQAPANAGSFYARIQSIGSATGSIAQTLSLTQGFYNLAFLAAGRDQSGSYADIMFDGALTYDVLLDGVSVFSDTTTTNSPFALQSVNGINVGTTGLHTISFSSRVTDPNHDATAFIDNVSLTAAVPEPATWAMMIFGLAAVGYAMRRRRAVTTQVSYAA